MALSAREAAVVIRKEAAQRGVGTGQMGRAGQAEFAGETILKSAPRSFDAPLGPRRVGSDVGNAELTEGAAELDGSTFAGELFLERPVIVVADEDTAAIAVEAEGNAVAAQ
ncbi:MAG: hypothetical protein WBQ34_07620 [Candidatus Acidiferrales bacterium]